MNPATRKVREGGTQQALNRIGEDTLPLNLPTRNSVTAPMPNRLQHQSARQMAEPFRLGDLFSSFLKRRLKIPPSNRATGLDQIPESLFPALACRSMLSLTMLDIISVVVIFFVGEMVLSRLLFKWHVRDRPF
jgi:CDP-archaeol synthase